MDATLPSGDPPIDTVAPSPRRAALFPWGAVAGAALLGAALRLAFLRTVIDLNGDEACTAVYAQHLLRGDWRYFAGVTEYFGPLHVALVALAFRFGGESTGALRAVSVLFGVALVPLVYLLARAAYGRAAPGVAAAFLVAVFPLHVALSRMAYSVSLLPTVDALALLCLLRFYIRGSLVWAALTGVLLGMGLQLHVTQYPFLAALAAEFLWRRRWRQTGTTAPLLLAVLAVLQSPFLLTPLLRALQGAPPECQFAFPSLAPASAKSVFETLRVVLSIHGGSACAELGMHPGAADGCAWMELLAGAALVVGGIALARSRQAGPLPWALAAVVLSGVLFGGDAGGAFAWRQRYFALLALPLPVVMAGCACAPGKRRRVWATWALLAVLAGAQVAQVAHHIAVQRRTPLRITTLQRVLPGLRARKPAALVVENWWLFWPARFFTDDRIAISSPDRHLSNGVPQAAGARTGIVWIGFLPRGLLVQVARKP